MTSGKELRTPIMTNFQPLTASFSVTGALSNADFAVARALGFATVINFRPDNEAADQISSHEAQIAASAAGLAYFHVPAEKYDLFADTLVTEAARVLAEAQGPVLAYCVSGQRAAIVWAAASSRVEPVDNVISALTSAGFDLDFLRDDLEAQADRARWQFEGADATCALDAHASDERIAA